MWGVNETSIFVYVSLGFRVQSSDVNLVEGPLREDRGQGGRYVEC